MSLKLLSHLIKTTSPGYGGSVGIEVEQVCSLENGDTSNNQKWSLANHFGTHMDAPYHFVSHGQSVDEIELSTYESSAVSLVNIEVSEDELIMPEKLEGEIDPASQVLLVKTGFEAKRSQKSYWNNNPGFHPETGLWLRKNYPNLRVIGFDFISLTAYQHREVGRVAHKEFLDPNKAGSAIIIVEDMKLSQLIKAPSWILISPLFIEKSDGSPVTVWCKD